jgi:hypothetical protein
MNQNVQLDTGVPHSARVYDYILGGKDNFKADRELADKILQTVPSMRVSAHANRGFMVRAARVLATQYGVRQFLDIGTGLPTSPNLHEVVQQVDPASRVVYVDNDPIVLVHARALLTSAPEGATAYIDADLRNPETILSAPELRILDLTKPVALSLVAILHFVPDDDLVRHVLDTLLRPLPAGSFLVISAGTNDNLTAAGTDALATYRASGIPMRLRTRAEMEDLFSGLELLDPGVVLAHHWHPDEQAAAMPDEDVHMYGGVAVKR